MQVPERPAAVLVALLLMAAIVIAALGWHGHGGPPAGTITSPDEALAKGSQTAGRENVALDPPARARLDNQAWLQVLSSETSLPVTGCQVFRSAGRRRYVAKAEEVFAVSDGSGRILIDLDDGTPDQLLLVASGYEAVSITREDWTRTPPVVYLQPSSWQEFHFKTGSGEPIKGQVVCVARNLPLDEAELWSGDLRSSVSSADHGAVATGVSDEQGVVRIGLRPSEYDYRVLPSEDWAVAGVDRKAPIRVPGPPIHVEVAQISVAAARLYGVRS